MPNPDQLLHALPERKHGSGHAQISRRKSNGVLNIWAVQACQARPSWAEQLAQDKASCAVCHANNQLQEGPHIASVGPPVLNPASIGYMRISNVPG